MILAVVKGNVVSTNKTEKLHGSKLLIVEEWNIDTKRSSGQPRVALDLVGAGEGELVMCVNGSSARQTEQTDKRLVDMAIVGIVDQVELNGSVCYKKYPSGTVSEAKQPGSEPEKIPESAPEKAPEPPRTEEKAEPAPEPKKEPPKARRVHPEPLILPGPAKPEKEPEPAAIPAVDESIDPVPNPYHGRQIDVAASEQFSQIVNRNGRQGRQNGNYGKTNRG